MANIFTSWKTSLVGLVGIIAAGLVSQKVSLLGIPPETLSLLLTGVIGFFAKDAGVTGAK